MRFRFICIAIIATLFHGTAVADIGQVVSSEHRLPANSARDVYRHPLETLMFFQIQQDMKVLEILPGRGWYTEILAPLLRQKGTLTVASFGADHENDYLADIHKKFVQSVNADPLIYDKVQLVDFSKAGQYLPEIADGSQDMVLTFRNTHNWIRFGGIEKVYQSFYRVLKPGGILGVVQHRADRGADPTVSAQKGYVPESYLINLLEDIGFELTDKSEINANPKDTKDYPEGVWSLPPSYREGDLSRKKYADIGESDRMTLRFVKLQ